jgi:hypothetical protein
MAEEDEKDRKERAARLRRRIGDLLRGGEEEAPPDSPREFVERERRRRERDAEEDEEETEQGGA